jgi:hypothetical protein
MKTKSKLFGTFDPSEEQNKEFCRDLRAFLGVTEQERKAAIEAFSKFKESISSTERTEVIDLVTGEAGLTGLQQKAIYRLMDFFLRQCIAVIEKTDMADDTIEMWTSDLRVLDVITESEEAVLTKVLSDFQRESLPSLHDVVRRLSYSAGVLPTINSFGATSELRAIRKRRLDWTSDSKDYVFDLGGFVAVGSIHIGTDSGHSREFDFQVDEKQLTYLISGLQQLLLELTELNKLKQSMK